MTWSGFIKQRTSFKQLLHPLENDSFLRWFTIVIYSQLRLYLSHCFVGFITFIQPCCCLHAIWNGIRARITYGKM
jgi:hypothetical protein